MTLTITGFCLQERGLVKKNCRWGVLAVSGRAVVPRRLADSREPTPRRLSWVRTWLPTWVAGCAEHGLAPPGGAGPWPAHGLRTLQSTTEFAVEREPAPRPQRFRPSSANLAPIRQNSAKPRSSGPKTGAHYAACRPAQARLPARAETWPRCYNRFPLRWKQWIPLFWGDFQANPQPICNPCHCNSQEPRSSEHLPGMPRKCFATLHPFAAGRPN
jgi:hypothetical protein